MSLPQHPIIRVQHVVKAFGKVTAVNDVSFDVRAGEIFAFLGPNGVRGLLTGRTHFGVPLDITVLLAVGVLFLALGAWRFSKIEA